MALILLLESATDICSVGLARDGELLCLKETVGYVHAEKLAVFIQDCLEETGTRISDLEAIGVSIGPGSYTGLRVGLSTAQGLAYGSHIPVLPVGTLSALVQATRAACPDAHVHLAAIDARRNEVYLAMGLPNGVRGPEPVILDEVPRGAWLENETEQVCIAGDGATKVVAQWGLLPGADTGLRCSAAHLTVPAEAAFRAGSFPDPAYIRPDYLKPARVTVPGSMFPQAD